MGSKFNDLVGDIEKRIANRVKHFAEEKERKKLANDKEY